MSKYYWHFVGPDKKLGYNDGRKIRRGYTLKVDPNKLELCRYGLHASERVMDALEYCYWKNPILCKVELSGKIVEGDDKSVASERRVIDYIYATKVLQKFALRVAKNVLPIFEKRHPNDLRVRNCIETTERFLNGKASKEDLITATTAAYDAARAAAYTAAHATTAAYDAAHATIAATTAAYDASYAAVSAARDAAHATAAATTAATTAVRAAYARKKKFKLYNKWLTEMVEDEMGGAK